MKTYVKYCSNNELRWSVPIMWSYTPTQWSRFQSTHVILTDCRYFPNGKQTKRINTTYLREYAYTFKNIYALANQNTHTQNNENEKKFKNNNSYSSQC